jgi:hypothetical protein
LKPSISQVPQIIAHLSFSDWVGLLNHRSLPMSSTLLALQQNAVNFLEELITDWLSKTSGRLPRYSWYKELDPHGKILPARG